MIFIFFFVNSIAIECSVSCGICGSQGQLKKERKEEER